MKHEYKSAIKSGFLAGVIWACFSTIAGLIYFKMTYSLRLQYFNGLLATNPNALSGSTASQYAIDLVLNNTLLLFLMGICSAILIELLFAATHPKLLGGQNYSIKGLIVGMIMAIVYITISYPLFEPFLVFTTFLITAFSGYLAGLLYARFDS